MEHRYKLERINNKALTYSSCFKVGRKSSTKILSKRKPLAKLSINTTKKLEVDKNWQRPEVYPRT